MVLILRKTETIHRRSFNSRFVVPPLTVRRLRSESFSPSLIQTVIKQKTLYPISLKPDTRPCIFFFERMMKNHIFALKQNNHGDKIK